MTAIQGPGLPVAFSSGRTQVLGTFIPKCLIPQRVPEATFSESQNLSFQSKLTRCMVPSAECPQALEVVVIVRRGIVSSVTFIDGQITGDVALIVVAVICVIDPGRTACVSFESTRIVPTCFVG